MDRQQKHHPPVFTQPTHIIAPSHSLSFSVSLSPLLKLSVHLLLSHSQAGGKEADANTGKATSLRKHKHMMEKNLILFIKDEAY